MCKACNRTRWRGRRGFTLLEVILAISLTIVLVSGMFAFYSYVLRARQAGTASVHNTKLDRAVLDRMVREIRQATSIVPGDGVGFRGSRHRIAIVHLVLPDRESFKEYGRTVDEPPPAQSDWRRVTYQLLWDDELTDAEGVSICHGLWRTEQRTFDPNPRFVVNQDEPEASAEGLEDEQEQEVTPSAQGELLAPEIKYLEFAYYDGAEWRDRWQYAPDEEDASDGSGGMTGGGDDFLSPSAQSGQTSDEGGYALPQAVRITVGRERVPPEEEEMEFDLLEEEREEIYHEDRFTVVVPVLQADRTLLSSRKYGVADSIARQEGGPQ
jgi:type II secretory pathway pseudopilin PulG